MKKYVVRAGDTMWEIAKRTGVRLNLLMAANPQITDPNNLTVGQTVMIPELTKKPLPPKPQAAMQPGMPGGAQTGVPGPIPGPVPSGEQEHIPAYFGFVWPHVVGPKESWQSIAGQYGLSHEQLAHLNPMETESTLNEGDVLYVPAIGPTQPGVNGGVLPMGSHGMPLPETQEAPWMQPGMLPGMDMGMMPGTDMGMPPGMDMGMMPGMDMGMMPGTDMGMMPGTDMGMMPGTDMGMMPGMGNGMGPAVGTGYDGLYVQPSTRGYGDDEAFWEWQAWGWTDVPFTTYQLPAKQHRSGQ